MFSRNISGPGKKVGFVPNEALFARSKLSELLKAFYKQG